MPSWIRMRLPARLGITHGALVALLVVLLVVTLQGLLRMLGLMTIVSEQRFSSLDSEGELHRSAWDVEVALRHARVQCAEGEAATGARERIATARTPAREALASHGARAPARLRDAALRYSELADEALSSKDTCGYLALPSTEERRMKLDEEMTNTWVDRLRVVHADIESKEETARTIGARTAASGLVVAALGALAAVLVARLTARSVTIPIARLAADARRLGDGDFTPIGPVVGAPEVEELRRDLERTREKLLGVDRLKQSFLASVSHELRTPLGRLREALALLGDGTVGTLTDKQQRVLTLARRACEQEVRIVEALLDMSRVTSGLPVQREAGCDMLAVVEAAVDAERAAADERGVTIGLDVREKPPLLRVDSTLVERAIANIVRNAVSVSPRGSEVRIELALRGPDRERVVRVDVIDRGPGLDEAVARRIFEPFNAAQVADRPAGIGLGLSLAREVARAHGGELDLTKTEGLTTFRLELPVAVEEMHA